MAFGRPAMSTFVTRITMAVGRCRRRAVTVAAPLIVRAFFRMPGKPANKHCDFDRETDSPQSFLPSVFPSSSVNLLSASSIISRLLKSVLFASSVLLSTC